MLPIYEIPNSIEELFENGETTYRIIDYDIQDMDNIQSMIFFVDLIGLREFIIEDYGTQIYLRHPKYKNIIVIDSGGLGDFYRHGFDVSNYEE